MLILTGPPASGKNTIGTLLARQRERCAVIDVDVVRAMAVQPHRAPWQGAEGWRQQRLGVLQACKLATGFAEDSWEVILLDVLSDITLPLYRQSLVPHQFKIVQLLPAWAECSRRFHERGPMLTADEFALLYREQEQFITFDLRLDNTMLAPTDVAAKLAALL